MRLKTTIQLKKVHLTILKFKRDDLRKNALIGLTREYSAVPNEENDGKVWTHRFVICCIWKGKGTCFCENRAGYCISNGGSKNESTNGRFCRMWNGHTMEYGVQLSVKCCSSIHKNSNMFKSFTVTTLLYENLSLWNSLHGKKLTRISYGTFCWQMSPVFTYMAKSTPINAGFETNKSLKSCTQLHYILLSHHLVWYDSKLLHYYTIFLWGTVNSCTCYMHYDWSPFSVNVRTFRYTLAPAAWHFILHDFYAGRGTTV